MTGWSDGAVSWSRTEFETVLRDPLLAMLQSSGLTNQIRYVLLSMDIPYRVQEGDNFNSTTSALFYGFKRNAVPQPGQSLTCTLPDYSSNSFAFSELPFELAKPNTAETNSLLAFMLTDDTLQGAESILNRALAGDSSFPNKAAYLQKTSDWARSVRFLSFDNAIFDSRIRGDSEVVRTNSDFTSFNNIRGLQTGFVTLSLPSDAFVPGAFGDSLTSEAGKLFENTGQTSLLAFLNAGAVASYGTVIEPCAYLEKFPDPLAFFYQARGFCVAETYYLSLLNPYQGLIVGEPLCAPFALPGLVDWQGLTNGTLLSGQAVLPTALFSSSVSNLPVSQVDLFIDGTFAGTVTNIPPLPGNQLSLSLNGAPFQYTVPSGATLSSVTADIADLLNSRSNATRVVAFTAGDRLELQSVALGTPASNVLLSASAAAGSADRLTTTISAAQPSFADIAPTGYFDLVVSNLTIQGDWLRLDVTKTNGTQISLGVTNISSDTNVANLCKLLMNAINAAPDLQTADGVFANDLFPDPELSQFLLYARTPGWSSAQIQAKLLASPNLVLPRPGTHRLQDNLTDLRPRNHLYFTAGLKEIPVIVALDTTRFADGFHELTLVGYEGTSVRTQTRISRTVQIQNTSLSAVLAAQIAGTNLTSDGPLNISVDAGTNTVLRIELFSTGGSLGIISNQQSAVFSVPVAQLGVGLHPFYALITDNSGHQFRTQTLNLRVLPSFQVAISGPPPVLSWNSVPGMAYDVLSATNLDSPFLKVATVVASGAATQWPIPVLTQNQAFFRVQLDQ